MGKRNLDNAVAQLEHETEIVWRAFELDPSAPKERAPGGDNLGRLAAKYGTSHARAQEMIDQMTARGAQCGLSFRFDRLRPANTFDAHRLLHFAGERGLQHALKERLMEAYFRDGRLVSDHAILAELAGEVGLPADEAAAWLATENGAREVRTEEATAHKVGITGVPFFVLAGRYAVQGAQPADALLEAMRQAWDETVDTSPSDRAGEVCGPDGCVLPTSSTVTEL